jgi:hypothetical protein
MNLRRAAQVAGLLAGLLGALAWVGAGFVWDGGSDPVELGLFWVGAALITLFLLELGTLLVKRGLLVLRLFVACALPLLFWMVIAFAAASASDEGLVYGFAGAVVGVFSIVQLATSTPQRATL